MRGTFVQDQHAWVELSDTATVLLPDGKFFSPFAENSYVARVRFEPDPDWTVVVLPPNARTSEVNFKTVAQAAWGARQNGERLAVMS